MGHDARIMRSLRLAPGPPDNHRDNADAEKDDDNEDDLLLTADL